jgi:hypothetical protein
MDHRMGNSVWIMIRAGAKGPEAREPYDLDCACKPAGCAPVIVMRATQRIWRRIIDQFDAVGRRWCGSRRSDSGRCRRREGLGKV